MRGKTARAAALMVAHFAGLIARGTRFALSGSCDLFTPGLDGISKYLF